MWYAAVQIGGSLLILAAFVLAMLRGLDQGSYRYLILNAVGSAVLAVTAIISHQWGFLLLEGVWALVSLYSLGRKMLARPAAAEE